MRTLTSVSGWFTSFRVPEDWGSDLRSTIFSPLATHPKGNYMTQINKTQQMMELPKQLKSKEERFLKICQYQHSRTFRKNLYYPHSDMSFYNRK